MGSEQIHFMDDNGRDVMDIHVMTKNADEKKQRQDP